MTDNVRCIFSCFPVCGITYHATAWHYMCSTRSLLRFPVWCSFRHLLVAAWFNFGETTPTHSSLMCFGCGCPHSPVLGLANQSISFPWTLDYLRTEHVIQERPMKALPKTFAATIVEDTFPHCCRLAGKMQSIPSPQGESLLRRKPI